MITQPDIDLTQLDLSAFTMPCEKGSQCRHPICVICGRPIRRTYELIGDHPGTIREARKGLCLSDLKFVKAELSEKDLEDNRHELLSDAELARMMVIGPHMFIWTMQRRYRLGLGKVAA